MTKREGLTIEKVLTDIDVFCLPGAFVVESGPKIGIFCFPCGSSLGMSIATNAEDFWSMQRLKADMHDEYGQDCQRCHIQLVAPDREWEAS